MFKIAICDNDLSFSNKVINIICRHMSIIGVLHEIDVYNSVEDLLELGIEVLKYNVVFIDINVINFNCIKTAKKIKDLNKDIFIAILSAYDEYALEGYKADAIRYILKRDNIKEAINECLNAIYEKMIYKIVSKTFNFVEGKKKVTLERLLFIESSLHKLTFYIMEDRINEYTLYETLNRIECNLEATSFIRIHQSFLVNMRHIRKIDRYSVMLSNGLELIIAKARYKYVEEAFTTYKEENRL